MKENLNDLKANIFSRAKIFIQEMNEFAPFGAKLIDEEIKDVVYYNGEENVVDSQKGIKILKDIFSKEIKKNIIQAGAIAFDVVINLKNADGKMEKRDAMCIETSTDGENWNDEYFPYMIIDKECIWK
jgi:hypothetical protein